MFIKLTLHLTGAIGREDVAPALINTDHVVKITTAKDGGSKVTYANGNTDLVAESRDLIERLLRGDPLHYYESADTEPPNPKDA